MCGAEPNWYVAQTKRFRERVAGSMLRRHFETYLPLIHEEPRPAVGSSIAPMFPSYVFVRVVLPEAYHRIMRTPGVRDLVRIAGEPGAIAAEGPPPVGPGNRRPPLGMCEPRDIASAVLYFATPMARYVTNQTICVDAGFSIT